MSISSALNNAVSGLTASSRMAEGVSSNLSNALTESYGRRSVDLSAAQVGGKGAGVRIDGISRFSDPALLADRRLAETALNATQRDAQALVRLENSLGGADSTTGLAARFAAIEKALISASSDPAAENRLIAVVTRLGDLASALNEATRTTQGQRQQADAAIATDVEKLNTGLRQVADLNKDIQRVKASGNDPSGLLDARQQLVDEIATIVPLREVQREDGTVALMTITGTNLLDGRPVQFGFVRAPTITADMSFASGALGGLTLNGVPLNPNTGIGRLGGGSLGAAFHLRDDVMVGVQSGLDMIAADLISRFQDPANDPTMVPGGAGMLTDLGNPFDPGDLPGLAGRLVLNAAIDPLRGGDPTLLRDGLDAAAAGPAGSSTQLDRWLTALSAPRSDVAGASTRSAIGRIAEFTADIGAKRLAAETAQSFAAAKWDSLRQAELANGVDTDFELQILLRVEQAYAANAKVIQTINSLMQRLMEI